MMKWFYDMKISAKLMSGFIIVALFTAIVGGVGLYSLSQMRAAEQEISVVRLPSIESLLIMKEAQNAVDSAENALLNEEITAADRIILYDKISSELKNAKDAKAIYDPLPQTTEEAKLWVTFGPAWDQWLKDDSDFVSLSQAYDAGRTDVIHGKMVEQALVTNTKSLKGTSELLDKVIKINDDVAIQATTNSGDAFTSGLTLIIIITIVGILMAIGLGLFISSIISKPLKKVNHLIKEMSMGHLGLRLNMDTKDEIGEMALSMDHFADDLQNVVIGTMKQISDGDVSINMEVRDEQDEIYPALKLTIETIRALIIEANMLSQAAVAGRLDTRGNANDFKGSFKEIVEGVNNTLDAVVGPLNVASGVITKIGKGQIPSKITETYNGDFNELKNNLNACINGLGALTVGNKILDQMSKNDFTDKIEGDYLGIYAEICKFINDIHWKLEHIVNIANNIAIGDMQDLEDLRQTGKRSEQDSLIPSLIQMIENIVKLVNETEEMARIAVAGDLNHRGDTSQFSGEYVKIIEGFNLTLDVIIAPIKEASGVLKELAKGNLNTSMTGDYAGHHAKIQEDMNRTIKFLKRIVDEIAQTLDQVGKGNLDQEITSFYNGDFVNIKIAINDITTSLSGIMSDIDVASNQVDSGAKQISDGGQALAQGTTEQASAIEELTASIEEVAGETKQNAIRANEANELAIDVRTNAEQGNTQMEEMVSAMVEINGSSKNISRIIKVIDDIAFQTNILALNAAVEAARAGQHGKGFAVVAEEVRSLAKRSAEAAKETTGLIEGSIHKVEIGTKIADNTAESLKEILGKIEKVAGLVGNIAQASNDQASEIAQITQGIEQVSQVVQTNSATAEESAAASEELSGQSEMLKEMVGTFRLKDKDKIGVGMRERKVSKPKPQKETVAPVPISTPAPVPRIILNDDEMDKY